MGGSIIEMAIVLAASALLVMQGIREDVAHRRAQLLAIEGQNEAIINEALSHWVTDNYAALLAQFVASGSATLTPPTIDQLFTNGNLKQPHRNGPFWGGTYTVTMTMVPPTCSASSGNCHVAYLMYPSQPLLRLGQPDVAGASQIAQAGGTSFGYSNYQNASTVSGLNGAWHTPNPLPGNPPAAIVATNALDSDGNSVYIRRDGSLTWTGDQNVNGVSLHNVNSIDATGTVKAGALVVANGTEQTSIGNDGAGNTNVYQDGALQVIQTGTNLYAPVNVGAVTSSGTIHAANLAVPRTYCARNGDIAGNSDGRGQQLNCLDHLWIPMSGPWTLYQTYTVYNTTVVPAPVCSAGSAPKIVVSTQNFYVDNTAVVSWVTQGAGPWTLYSVDGAGVAISAMGIASTYCAT
ncbi:hypothetical protein [Paraburkholderia sp. BCC1876]|uniref:hypothetical protein n=1 Tax=Paraburkholderia sp. BCC1876 TaxID=2676303 RepID=UPI001591C0C8|nr:hypothetical protein [Paraburkholderia sp. BCC1876]